MCTKTFLKIIVLTFPLTIYTEVIYSVWYFSLLNKTSLDSIWPTRSFNAIFSIFNGPTYKRSKHMTAWNCINDLPIPTNIFSLELMGKFQFQYADTLTRSRSLYFTQFVIPHLKIILLFVSLKCAKSREISNWYVI